LFLFGKVTVASGIASVLLLSHTALASTVHADELESSSPPTKEVSATKDDKPIVHDEVAAIADEAGVNAVDLQGALNTLARPTATPTTQRASSYLCYDGYKKYCMVAPASAQLHRVRLTYYTLTGRTANGEITHSGGTACSWNFSFGTRFRFPNGEVFTCNDRGVLESTGWLDVWARPDLQRQYGSYVNVEVLR